MKKYWITLFLWLACIQATTAIELPTELLIFSPEEINNGYLTHFYPIGFSPSSSTFAYCLYRTQRSGIGSYTSFSVCIQDLVSDDIHIAISYDSSNLEERIPELSEEFPVSFGSLWYYFSEDIESALSESGIIQTDDLELHPFPYIDEQNQQYMLRIETFSEEGSYSLESFWIAILRTGGQSKRIHSSGETNLGWIRQVGIVRSPYEQRVAVLLIGGMRGFEGPPHDYDPIVIGCSLTHW